MNLQEKLRLTDGLYFAGWNEKEINDFILFLKSGDKKYLPNPKNKTVDHSSQTK